MRFPEITRLSPNFDASPVHEKRGVLIHHSSMPFADTIEFMLKPENKVSYHALISPDGERCTLVTDEHIAWHAGASQFLGRTRCNDFLLGLAFAGDTYEVPLANAQIESALEWLANRWEKYHWRQNVITDHRQVSPGRKNDLNPVEWERVHAAIATRFG